MNSITSKILTFVVVICVGIVLISTGFHMLNQKYKTETAILATADDSIVFKGVYIRDEEVVTYGGTGAVSYCISDGGKLGAGSLIAEIYADEGQIDIKQKISDLNDELQILNKIQNPGTLESAQPANISSLINEKYRTVVNSREKGHLEQFAEQKSDLLVLLSTYQLVTDPEVDFGERINAINAEISKLKRNEAVPHDRIAAAHSAYFVSYADGYENELKKDTLSKITPELINDIKDKGPVDDSRVIGKLINGYEWFIAGVIDSGKREFAVDDDVTVKFQSASDTAEGTIYDIRDTGDPDKKVIIIRCDEITYDFVQHRTERVEMVAGEVKGIKVPRRAIRFFNTEETVYDEKTGEESSQTVNSKGVWVKLGERVSFKKIDVVYEGSDYVLSDINAGSGYLALYDDIVVEGVESDEN